MKVLILSKRFPAYHPRAGEPTGFAEKFASGEKIHTIRANAHGHFEDGEKLSVRQWIDRPYASKQVEIGHVVIGVEKLEMEFDRLRRQAAVPARTLSWDYIARNDGLSIADLLHWFFPCYPDPPFGWHGDIIHFTDFRYGKG